VKQLSLVLLALLAALPSPSPWPKPLGGPDQEYAKGLALDDLDNTYLTGSFEGQASAFDGVRLASAGKSDAFVAKIDREAHTVWAVGLGGAGADEGLGIAASGAGDVYVTGTFSGTVDFDPGPGRTELTSAGGSDAFLLRLSPKGELVWARRLGGTLDDAGLRIALNKDAVWVAGTFEGGLEGSADNLVSAGKSDAFVAKLDLDGKPLWMKRIGGAKDDEGCGVALGRSGEAWVAGTFKESPSIGPDGGGLDMQSAGHKDVFLLRLDPTGRLLWSGRIGGVQDEVCGGIAATVAGGVAVVGQFATTADLDPGPGVLSVASHGLSDAFLVRLDGNGRLVWGRGFGEIGPDTGTAVTGDRYGSVYAVGHMDRPRSEGGSMAWVAEHSDSGERAWSVGLQASGSLDGAAIALNPQGLTIVAGSFKGETKELREASSPRVKGFGKSDAFVWRLVPRPTTPARIRP
jgi:hypothetical protein